MGRNDEIIKDLQEQLDIERDFNQSFKDIMNLLKEENEELKASNVKLFKALLEAREETRLLQEEIDRLREGYTGP